VVFSSNLFLFWFLPAVLTVNYLLPRRFENRFLFLASTFFYLWGGGTAVVPFLLAIALNYYSGALIAKTSTRISKAILVVTLVADLSLLFYYKYYNFFCDQLSSLLRPFGVDWHTTLQVTLPIGVSFFVFQAMTYPIEVYRRQEDPVRRLSDLGAYLLLFPHLIAGPVVRYSDISRELGERSVDLDGLFQGVLRFAAGLGKKVILANQLGSVADEMFGARAEALTPAMAWTGTVFYGLQIYFDFSGYSDMAIGLARFLGFHFPENFNEPYRAASITDFWRRWHITLSRWFRDFLYIPLGGNRKGALRTYSNLFTVFFLCGLWHGAAWNFVVWGLFHGTLLVLERILDEKFGFVPSGPVGTVGTCLLVFIGWVFFRAPDTSAALHHLAAMFGLAPKVTAFQYFPLQHFLTPRTVSIFCVAAILLWGPTRKVREHPIWNLPLGTAILGASALLVVFYAATILSTVSYNPFIYFRF
jgi:alginate O-acetyltransferase complex protein AlgI